MNSTKVIIIGNGSSVIGKHHGELINSHDEVIRFNRFNTKTFEEDVGNKTTQWFTGIDVFPPSIEEALNRQELRRVYLHSWVKSSTFSNIIQRVDKYLPATNINLERLNHNLIPEMCERINNKSYNMWSTGALATWLLLKTHSYVSLIGFDWWNSPPRHHYMDDEKFIHVPHKGHQPLLEKEFFDGLVNEGRILFIP